MDSDGRGGREELGRRDGGGHVIRIYYVRKDFIFNTKQKQRESCLLALDGSSVSRVPAYLTAQTLDSIPSTN